MRGCPTPHVSVVVPAYNAESTLERALESVAHQFFEDWEIILVDDSSLDSTTRVFDAWASLVPQRVIRIRTQREGPSAARNAGVAQARGSLVAFLDADDYWDPWKLLRQVEMMDQTPNLSGVTCDVSVLVGASQNPERVIRFDWGPQSILKWITMEGPGPGLCSTLLVRNRCFHDVQGFDRSMWNLEDVDLALRLLQVGKIATVHESLCFYVMGSSQNHTNLATVGNSAETLLAKSPFAENPKLRRRLKTNLALVVAYRLWKRGRRAESLRRLVKAFVHSPRHVLTRLVAEFVND